MQNTKQENKLSKTHTKPANLSQIKLRTTLSTIKPIPQNQNICPTNKTSKSNKRQNANPNKNQQPKPAITKVNKHSVIATTNTNSATKKNTHQYNLNHTSIGPENTPKIQTINSQQKSLNEQHHKQTNQIRQIK